MPATSSFTNEIDLYICSRTNYFIDLYKCLKEPNLGESRNGNDTVALAKVGRIWFICGMADHLFYGGSDTSKFKANLQQQVSHEVSQSEP